MTTTIGTPGFHFGFLAWEDLPPLPAGWSWVLSNEDFVKVLSPHEIEPHRRIYLFQMHEDVPGAVPWKDQGWHMDAWTPFDKLPQIST
jgi:hypothetical protein